MRIGIGSASLLLSAVASASLAAQQRPPVRPVGAVVAKSTEALGNVTAIRQLPGGRVLVNDVPNRRVLLFEPSLATFTVVADSTSATANAYSGRFAGLIPYKGDSTIFVDPVSLSMLVIDGQGKVGRVMSVPRSQDAGMLAAQTAGVDPLGRLLYRAPPNIGRPSFANGIMSPPDIPDSGAVLRIDLTSRKVDTIGFIKTPKVKFDINRDDNGGMRVTTQINPLPVVDEWAPLPDGSVAFVRGRDYHVDFVSADGTNTVSLTAADDVATLSRMLIKMPSSPHSAYNVGGPPTSMQDVAKVVKKLFPNAKIEFGKDPPPPELAILPGVQPLSAGQPTNPLVAFEKVAFGYEPGTEVLRGIDLQIRRGDVIAVLGPNGAGKTTFVKHAIGLLKPRSGRVLVDGRDTRMASVAQIASTLGYVFQSPSHMLFAPSVHEELAFGPKNLKHSADEIEKEVREALDIVNLSEYEKDPPLALSFGQQKRVSIAAILAMRSRILVMDEPTAGQDYQNYMNFMDAILQLPGFEAILFITHDVDLAVIFANRVLLVADGCIVADGTPAEVLGDARRLESCRLVPTSLLAENIKMFPQTGRFMRAEALAHL